MTNLTDKQLKLLAESQSCSIEDIDLDDFNICTDDQADRECGDNIRESICFFNTSFLISHAKENVTSECFNSLKEHYESANGSIRELIKDFEYLVEDAISQDGRGHFLSHYDGEEIELIDGDNILFAYRIN